MTPFSKSGAPAVAALLVVLGAGLAYGADPPAAGDTVSRTEYEALKKEMLEMRQEITELRQQKTAAGDSKEVAALRQEVADLRKAREQDQKDNEEANDDIIRTIKEVKDQAKADASGAEKLLITGDASVGFQAYRHSPSTFTAEASPRFLWKLDDHLMFDAAFDVGIGRDSNNQDTTSFDLTIASLTYILNDNLVVGGGLFVPPFAAYHRDFDPPWINRLPDDPLVFGDNPLAPSSVLGAFIGGAYPIGPTKINYALYVTNGAVFAVNNASTAGQLDLNNFTDLKNAKAVGGRVGFLPIPQLEVGYSFLTGEVNPDGVSKTNSFLQAVDFQYTQDVDWLAGNVRLRAEWVFSHVGDATYSGTDVNTGLPYSIAVNDNNRNGGYVQASYRPSQSSIKFLRNFELIERYDRMDAPNGAPGTAHEQRYTTGLDYWLDARSVLKFAYECDDIAQGSGASAYLFQFGVGF